MKMEEAGDCPDSYTAVTDENLCRSAAHLLGLTTVQETMVDDGTNQCYVSRYTNCNNCLLQMLQHCCFATSQ